MGSVQCSETLLRNPFMWLSKRFPLCGFLKDVPYVGFYYIYFMLVSIRCISGSILYAVFDVGFYDLYVMLGSLRYILCSFHYNFLNMVFYKIYLM